MPTPPKKKSPAKPPAPKAAAEGGAVLYLRNMPDDVMAELSAWVEEIKASSLGGSNITRTDLARDILCRIARGTPVEPRKRPAKGGGA